MSKLYPPIIESTVPACYEENGMVKLTIPFSMNRAVSASQIGGFELKIKTVQTGTFLYTVHTINPANYEINDTESYVIFYLKDIDKKLKVGQFYKIQLAYIGMDASKRKSLYNSYMGGTISLNDYETEVKNIGTIGYYSAVGAIKYTTKPRIYINEFKENSLNEYTHDYVGYYNQENGDITERVYSYQFNVYDNSGTNIIASSGECIHNSSNDTNEYLSIDNYSIMLDLKYNKIYYIEYIVTTINKMILSSPKYRIIQRETIEPEIKADLFVIQNFNNGYINISLLPQKDFYMVTVFNIINELIVNRYTWLNSLKTIKEKGFSEEQANIIFNLKDKIIELTTFNTDINIQMQKEKEKKKLSEQLYSITNCSGAFVLCRADEDSSYSNWEELYRFNLFNETPDKMIYRDFTVAQGKKYQYSLQQYNDYGLFSKRMYSDIILADFEDAFLYDGQRQLKIRYNPKITKFTNTVLEQKQDTIGGQYPFIFRNGNVNYHEFPIAGLISYLSDEEFLFITKEELNIPDKYHRHNTLEQEKEYIDLRDSLSENITRERIFKTKVLEWLNNGKPKLFRSPTEGNFLVRLIKNSFSPENKLGRMLHNFSCTAYEIAELNSDNLKKLGFINSENKELNLMKFFTKNLSECSPNATLNTINNVPILISGFKCEDMFFGDELLITYEDGNQENIRIGITGNYEVDQLKLIKGISILPRYKMIYIEDEDKFKELQSSLYIKDKNNNYQKLNSTSGYSPNIAYYYISNNPLKGSITFSYFETEKNNFASIKNISYLNPTYRQFIGAYKNIVDEIEKFKNVQDIKKQFVEWYYIKVEPRPIDKVIRNNDDKNTIYYYGLDEYSDKLKFSEIRYPIGLRVYEPGKYYKNIGDTEFTNDAYDLDNLNYYMYGKYQLVSEPIGKTVYEPGKYYIKNYIDGKENYTLSEDNFNKFTVYYEQQPDEYKITRYVVVDNLTSSEDYVFEKGKFYQQTENGKYTLANSFINEWELNEGNVWEKTKNHYYQFVDMTPRNVNRQSGEGYHNAYVTISKKYLYQSREYYMQVTLKDKTGTNSIEKIYIKSNSGDFNMHGLTDESYPLYDFNVEYDLYNKEVIKYYKVKPILPHYIYQIGEEWNLINTRDITPNEVDDTISEYSFIPVTHKKVKNLTSDSYKPGKYYIYNSETKKYEISNNNFDSNVTYYELDNRHFIDFYNNEQFYENYEPWIEINNQRIQVDDTLIFYKDNLKDLENITSLATGNGVIVEIGYQLKNIDYLIEDDILLTTKNAYLEQLQALKEKYAILSDPTHKDYIDLSQEPKETQLSLYNSYINHTFSSRVNSAYSTLLSQLSAKL